MKAHNRFLVCSLLIFLACIAGPLLGQNPGPSDSRQLTLTEAVQLALSHHHAVRLAALQVQEKQHAKDVAKSTYYPVLRNETNVVRVTDRQFIAIPAGSLGGTASAPVPAKTIVIEQGGLTLPTNGTSLTQPLTGYLKFRPLNDLALAERGSRQEPEGGERRRSQGPPDLLQASDRASASRATQARIQATDALRAERVEQVKHGSLLEEELIDSRAQYLEAKQDLLSTELQLSDLTMQLNDVMGLRLATQLALDPSAPVIEKACPLAIPAPRPALDAPPSRYDTVTRSRPRTGPSPPRAGP
jgi:hypothetical protein